MKFKKKGQDNADAAAVLIGIIALILIFYIVFLPPEERDVLLGEENQTTTTNQTTTQEKGTLLKETGLVLSFLEEGKEQEISIPNFALSESKPDKLILSHPGFIVKKGFFKDQPKELKFSTDLKNLEKVFLTFTTPQHDGVLKLFVNNNELFEGRITTDQPQTIEVNKDLLKQDNTVLITTTSGEYEFKNFNIVARTIELEKLMAVNNFNLENNVVDNIKEAKLSYYLSCNQQTTDMLEIIINNNKLFSATPVCESPNVLKLSKSDFVPGKNILLIKAEKGEYSFDQIKFKLDLSEAKDLVRYFEIDQTLYDQIIDDEKKIILKMNFVSEKEFKEAEISINGRLTRLDQKEKEYKKEITSMIQQGTNFIQITPKSRLEIVDLTIKPENA